jgi:hypothetical protein
LHGQAYLLQISRHGLSLLKFFMILPSPSEQMPGWNHK